MPSFLRVPGSRPMRPAPHPAQAWARDAVPLHPPPTRHLPLGWAHEQPRHPADIAIRRPLGYLAACAAQVGCAPKNAEIAWQPPPSHTHLSPSAEVRPLSPYRGDSGGCRCRPGKEAVAWPARWEPHAGFVCAGAPSPSSPQMVRSHDCTVKIELV